MKERMKMKEAKSISLTRKLAVEEGFDIVVAGGGSAGVAAAISAGRLGAKVLLLEATGALGGMGSNGCVSVWYSLGDGKRMIVGGLIKELVESLCRSGSVGPAAQESFERRGYFDNVAFNPESLKILLDRLCLEAGVEVRFYSRVVDAQANPETGVVDGVVVNSVEGNGYVRAPAFIDASGDAVLAELCGAKSRAAGRDTSKIMPPTLCALIADVDYSKFDGSQQRMVEKAVADGFFSQADRHVPGLFRNGGSTAIMNAGHLFGTDALKTRSLSAAMAKGRLLAQEYASFYRKYMPGCENMKVIGTGSLLGVRESRRVAGEYEANYGDFQARREFPDQVAVYTKSIDIHVYDLSPEEYRRYYEEYNKQDCLKEGERYGLPYGIVVPKGWANLWVAGRCSSSDIKVNGAIRDQPACSMLGQAAGTAAVQSLRSGQPANRLDTAELVETLRKNGAYLPQEKLSQSMTRS